jgi:hypothetical protein
MSYFMQATEHDMNMYANLQCMNMLGFFVINLLKIWVLRILYNEIMHKCKFVQAYC